MIENNLMAPHKNVVSDHCADTNWYEIIFVILHFFLFLKSYIIPLRICGQQGGSVCKIKQLYNYD
jgi:hypothetical protein